MMAFNGFEFDEDDSMYRRFMQSEQFKAVVKALRRYEYQVDGLTPSEVWHEVDLILFHLKTLAAENRDIYMEQVMVSERRRLKQLDRDGQLRNRTDVEVRRSLTCIFYCLCLRLERTSRNPSTNPHSELIDAIVRMLLEMDDPVLPLLFKTIKEEGDRQEAKCGRAMDELNPLAEDSDWTIQWSKVADHYANRLHDSVKMERRDSYAKVWEALKKDERVASIMQQKSHLTGDEHEELEVNYNAKAMFNILGLMYSKGFFQGFRGVNPFAKKATGHYERETKNMVSAKKEYFTPENVGIKAQFIALNEDDILYIKKLLSS